MIRIRSAGIVIGKVAQTFQAVVRVGDLFDKGADDLFSCGLLEMVFVKKRADGAPTASSRHPYRGRFPPPGVG